MNFEPNKLALLISLICAGAPTVANGKTSNPPERQGPTREACNLACDLATPQAWPLILNGIRDTETSSLRLSLPVAAGHDFQPLWHAAQPFKTGDVVDRTPLRTVALESVDPLEAANAFEAIDRVEANSLAADAFTPVAAQARNLTPGSESGPPAASIKRHTKHRNAIAPFPAAEMRLENAVSPRGDVVITLSAQRVMRSLAAIRFPALESARTAVDSAHAPPWSAAEIGPSPSSKVLATLSEVLTAPILATATADITASQNDEPRLEDAIAARREAKRMKQRARGEEAALAMALAMEEAAQAQTHRINPSNNNPFGSERLAVRDTALDSVRGGFVTNNLNIAFGIERAVYINGALITTTSLNITETGRISSSTDAKTLTPATLALIQSGAGNSVAGGAFSSTSGVGLNANAIGTVVQNTLDGQKIQNVTVINATANSMGVLRELNLQNSLRSALIDSLRR